MSLQTLERRLENFSPFQIYGKITQSIGLLNEAHLPGAIQGSRCAISGVSPDSRSLEAEVVGFRGQKAMLMALEEGAKVSTQSLVRVSQRLASHWIGEFFLGRVLDGQARSIDGKGDFVAPKTLRFPKQLRSLDAKPVPPLQRKLISEPLDLGIKAINGLVTCGKGQRMGILAGSGVGKSVLLGMMARASKASINVIALIGERGREVREFLETDLGAEALKRSVVIVSTSDESPLLRVRAAFLATSIAEYFRDQGEDVLFLMDSVTRFCMAQREISLSLGEPPASKGYTPSVFSMIPKLLERAGMGDRGSITGLYTVLVEGDDFDEPIADATRSILDGHLILSRKIAEKNHFPAIDILKSTSRVMRAITTPEHQQMSRSIREWLALLAQFEDLLAIGAYSKGSQPKLDQAIVVEQALNQLLRQEIHQQSSLAETLAQMRAIHQLAGV